MPAEWLALLALWSLGCATLGAAAALTWTAPAHLDLVALVAEAQAENRRLRSQLAMQTAAVNAVAEQVATGQLEGVAHPPTLIHEMLIAQEEVTGVAADS